MTSDSPIASGTAEPEAIDYPGYPGEPERIGWLQRWFRRNEAPKVAGQLHAGPSEGGLEGTFGSDAREQVPDTSTLPWSAICHLEVDFGGRSGYGTGFLVAPGMVLTAAHVLHPRGLRRGRSVRVMPGRNDTAAATLFQDSTSFYLSPKWDPDAHEPVYDYALITVDGGPFAACGTLAIQSLNDADLRQIKKDKLQFSVAGYPKDKPRGTLWRSRGPLLDFGTSAIYYTVDTKSGQSGGPVFAYSQDDKAVAFAIHVQGDQAHNVARRIHGLAASEIAQRLGPGNSLLA